jgi:hypothetical protein
MQPGELNIKSFDNYPPLAREQARKYLPLLQELPLLLTVVLLREIIQFDTRFPREQAAIQGQLNHLSTISLQNRKTLVESFNRITLSPSLIAYDWVNAPQKFEEQLSAHLWASHQIDQFHAISIAYVAAIQKALPAEPLPSPRWAAVVLNPDLRNDAYPLFRKLRPHGVYFPHIEAGDGMPALLAFQSKLAAKAASPYGHWYIDGGTPHPYQDDAISSFSWSSSSNIRETVLSKVHSVIDANGSGPEMLSSAMAAWAASNKLATGPNAPLQELVLSVYGDGSGTQIFSTTFVQWSSREIMRRAEPLSFIARYGTRQKQRGMNEMFSSAGHALPDPAGSLVDADLGAYYTWINLGRLSGADSASFLAWSEAHQQAVAIGPGFPRGTQSTEPISLTKILHMISA